MSTLVNIRLGYKNSAWFTANPTLVLLEGQHVYLSDGADEFIEAYVIGDGTTTLSVLPWRGLTPIEYKFTVSGNTQVLADSNPSNANYYLNGLRCEVGGAATYDISSIVGTLVTFNEDRTGDRFIAIY